MVEHRIPFQTVPGRMFSFQMLFLGEQNCAKAFHFRLPIMILYSELQVADRILPLFKNVFFTTYCFLYSLHD